MRIFITLGITHAFVNFVAFHDTMCKLGVEEWLVSAVTSKYAGAKTIIRTVCDSSNGFEVKVSMHEGSELVLCYL